MRAWLFLSLFSVVAVFGQSVPPSGSEAEKYHQMLLKRPQAGLVYDRFFAAWLETGTVESLTEFLTKKTETTADLLLLAVFHEQRGHEAEALKAYTAALERDAANAHAWVQRAKLEARMLDFTAALKSLDAAEKNGAGDELRREIGQVRGRWLLRTGKPELALQAWRDMLKANADDDDLAEEIIELQLDEGLYAEAEAQMTALIARTTDAYAKVVRKLRLAEIFLRAAKKEPALAVMAETLADTGQGTWIEGEVLAQIEAVFRRDENLSGLAKQLETLQAAHPQRTALDRQRARVLAELGEKDKALAIYAALLQKTPGQRELRESYLDLLDRFEQFKEAIAQTNVLLEQSPDDKELLIRLATLQERAKDKAASKAALEKFLAAQGTTEFDHLRVARLYESWERGDDATLAYERMVTAFPDSTAAKEAQAHYLHRSGKRDAALTIWKALAKNGDLPQVMAVGQALMTRLESLAAMEVLQARQAEFERDERFLGLLINAALGAKKSAEAIPWALARVRATQDPSMLDDALRQALQTLKDDAAKFEATVAELKSKTMSAQERILLAALLEEKEDRVGAEKALQEMPAEHALAAQTRLLKLMETRQDWLRAAQEAEKLVAMPQGKNSANVQRLVDLAERSGKPDEALKWVKEWKILSPGSATPWLREARLMQLSGKAREALPVLQAASRRFEDDEAVADALASGYADIGQLSDAERIYIAMFEKAEQPEDKMRWVATLARVANDRGQLKPLTEKFAERQRTNRADAAPWLALSEIHRVAGNTTEQERALREAMRLRPDDANLAMQIARADLDMGRWKQAVEGLERIAGRAKGGRVRQMIASIQIEHGDASAGYRMLYEIAGGAQMDVDDALTLAKSMTARQDWKRALSFLEPLVKQHPLDYRLGYLQAVALEEENMGQQAAMAFIKLMAQTEELPKAVKAANPLASSAMSKYMLRLEKMMPAGCVGLVKTMSFGLGYQAYNYRSDGIRFSSQSPSRAVLPPTSLESLQSSALVHLVSLLSNEQEVRRKELLAAAQSARVPNAEHLQYLEMGERYQLQVSAEAVEKAPDDDALLALRLMTGASRQQVDFALASRAFERFKTSYPLLAISTAFMAARADAQQAVPLVDQAIAIAEKLPEDDFSLIGTSEFVTALGGTQSLRYNETTSLPEEARKRVLAFVMRSLDRKMDAAFTAYSVIPNLANACRRMKAWDEFVTLMEHEVRDHQDAAKQRSTASFWAQFSSRRGQPKGMLEPLDFPFSSAMPPQVRLFFKHDDIYNADPLEKMTPAPEDYAELLPRLDKVKDATLRVLMAYMGGDNVRAEKEVTQRLEAKDAGLDDFLLGASWFSLKDNHPKAAELLGKAAALPMAATVRPAFDAALAHAVLQLKPDAQKPLLEPAQMAVRRLRSARITTEQRDELLAAMKSLSMTEEAEQWARIATVAPTTTSRSSSMSYSSSSIDTTKLKQLAGAKDEEATVKEAVVQLRRAISQAGNGNQSYAQSRAKEIMRLVGKPGMYEKIQAAFDPGQNATVTKMFEHAQFLELIAEKEKARAVLEKVVEANPKHYEARLRLCALIAQSDSARAVKLLTDVPHSAFQQSNLGNQIATMLNDDNAVAFEARMNITSTLAGMLEAAAVGGAAGIKGLEWMIDLPAIIADESYRAPKLTHLYFRPQTFMADDDERTLPPTAPESVKRREIHDRLCLALMKHPALAEEGFRRFACLAINDGGKLDELAATARQLLEQAKNAVAQQRNTGLTRRFGFYQEVTGLWAPTPAEFLVWKAWKENKPDEIEKNILPLAAALDSTRQSILRAEAQVWTCKEAEFIANAKTFLTTVSGRGSSSYGDDPHLVWLIDRWEERGIAGMPLDDLIAASMKQARSYGSGYAMSHYLSVRQRLRPEVGLEPFLVRVIANALGNKQETWAKTMKPTLDARYGGGGSMNNPTAYTLLQITDNLIRKPATFGAGLQMASLIGAAENAGWQRNTSYNLTTAAKSAENALPTLRALGWMGEAEQIKLTDNPNGLQVVFIKKLRENRDTCQDLRPRLAALKTRTFGVELCEALVQDAPGGPLSALLKRRATDVAKIPAQSGPAFMALVKSQITALNQPATADQALVKVLDPFLGQEKKQALGEIDKWIAAVRTDDVTTDHDAYDQKLVEALRMLIPTDRDKAEKLFLKASELIEAKQRSGRWDGYSSGNGWTVRSEALDQLLVKMPKVEAIGFVMHLYHTDTTGHLAMNGWSQSSGYGQALIEIWRNNGGAAAMGRGIEAMLKALAAEMRDTPHTLLGIAFHDFFTKLPAAQRVPALNWAAKAPKDHPHAALVRELDHAGRIFIAHDPQPRQNVAAQKTIEALGGLQPAWEHYRGQLGNNSVNTRVRQALAHHLAFKTVDDMDAECARLGAAAALESMKQKHCIHGYQYGWILRSFNRLPADAAWKAAAQEHWDAWLARCNSGGLNAYNPYDWAINSVLRMTARAGNDDWMRETLRRFHHTLSNESSGIVSLMLGGQPKLAAEHFKAEWRGFLMDPQGELLWSKEIVENLPAFREACGDAGLALLGEIFISYLKDPAKHAQAAIPGFKSREERFKDLAKRFKETKFTDDDMRTDAVEMICNFYDAAAMIRDDVDAVAAKTDIAALAAYDETWEHWRQLKPLQFSLGWKAANGDVQPNIAAYDRALAAQASQSYYQRSLVKETGWGPSWVANWHWGKESEAGREPNIRAISPFLEHVIAKTPKDLRDMHVADCISQKWLIHIVSGEAAAFDTWRKGLSEEDRRDFRSRLSDRWEIWNCIRQFAGTQKKMRLTPEKRGQLVAAVAKDEWCAAKYPAAGPGIPNLINDLMQKSKLFKNEELAAAVAPIAEALPRLGRTASEAAEYLAANGQPDAAVPLYALAFTHARKGNEKDYGLAAGYAIKQAETLERTGKKPEAAKVLAELDDKRLGAAAKKTRDAALARLTK